MVGPGDRRTARVYAKTPVRCLAIGRSELEEVLAAEPALADALRELARSRLPQR
jgi:CRP-like cAMP-binding protein